MIIGGEMVQGINNSSMLFLILLTWNVITFFIMGMDKRKAIKGKWRTPEKTLFFIAFLFGGIGVFLAMRIFRHKTKHNSFRILIPMAVVVNIVLGFFMFKFVSGIEVTNYNVVSNKLSSEFDGFKIVQVSDFHNGTFDDSQQTLINKVKNQKPDIITITGDIIDESTPNLDTVSKLLDELIKISPVYYVSGNHDVWYPNYSELQKLLVNKGVILLDNKKTILKRGNSHINLYGIGDPNVWDSSGAEKYVKREISVLKPNEGFNILLFHRANMFDTLKGNGYQLILSGHMHGGQVQIPFIGGLRSPHGTWFPKYAQGKWEQDGTTMIVSRGLGNIVWAPRILNPPEIVAVTLKTE
jgi:predicted MPP superfamily phosphohydrolase